MDAPQAGTNMTLTNSYALWVDAGNVRFDGALLVGNPTGGMKNAGEINAQAVYDDNTLLVDYVFEKYYLDKPIDEKYQNYKMKSLDRMPTML